MTELFLIAQVACSGVAIDGSMIDSVVDIGTITPVPRSPDSVRGLAALRSRVLTVIDTRLALGLAPTERPGRAVIAVIDAHPYAFLVDAVEDVAPFQRLPLAAGVVPGRGWTGGASGLVERGGEPLAILDLAALVPGMGEHTASVN